MRATWPAQLILAIVLSVGFGGTPALARVGIDRPIPGTGIAAPAAAGDELWSSQFALGANDWIYATVVAPNGDLYVGGDFDQVAGVPASRVARWSAATNRWSALAGSPPWGRVLALAISGDRLYVGGYIFEAGGVSTKGIVAYTISTGTWASLGGGLDRVGGSPEAAALAVDGAGNLYVGGQFDSVGGVLAQNVAKWNGSSWSALAGGLGTTDNKVNALTVSGSDVYAGGDFTAPTSHVARFTGSAWTSLGGGASGEVIALAMSGSNLYVGGAFTTVYDTIAKTVNYVAMWNGSAWAALGGGLDGPDADAIVVDGSGMVYVAGRYGHVNGTAIAASNVARWNGGTWSHLGNPSSLSDGVAGNGYALAISGSDVYVAGGFTHAGGWYANNLARWNVVDQQWYSPGGGVNGSVFALALDGSDTYVGGAFTSAGGLKASGVARWSNLTNSWSALGSGLSGCSTFSCVGPVVRALAVNGGTVYVGGNFVSAGGLTANNVARWSRDSQSWSTMSGGVTGCSVLLCGPTVYTLALDGAGVAVGGLFNSAGSTTANNVAKWTGSSWTAFTDVGSVHTGTNGAVYAIARDGNGNYYFGGSFTTPLTNFVRFSLVSWSSDQSAPNGTIRAIALSGNDIYVGGDFTNAAGSGANYVARASGAGNWTPLGNGVNGSVYVLNRRGGDLFAGGTFTQSAALGVARIARWDPVAQTWSNLGSGADGYVAALAADTDFLYAGGAFANVGGKGSAGVGRWGQYHVFAPFVRR